MDLLLSIDLSLISFILHHAWDYRYYDIINRWCVLVCVLVCVLMCVRVSLLHIDSVLMYVRV